MRNFEKVVENIFRLCIPFENIYTSVFLIIVEDKAILIDGANSPKLAVEYVFPALNEIGIKPNIIINSHAHGDHSGGVFELAKLFPFAKIGMMQCNRLYDKNNKQCLVFEDSEVVFDEIMILNLKGHSEDSLAVYDMRTKTLITSDCLQLAGVGRYGTAVTNAKEYLNSLQRIKEMNVKNIISSHEYVPFGYKAIGCNSVNIYIDKCEEIIMDIKNHILNSNSDDYEEIARHYNNANKELPQIYEETIESVKKLLDENS